MDRVNEKTKKLIAWEVILGGAVLSTLSTIAATLHRLSGWASFKSGELDVMRELQYVLTMFPFCMVGHLLLPTGWLFILGAVFAVKKCNRWFYLLCFPIAIFVGVAWPRFFWGLMSV
jgi:hypothetical protein